MVANLLKTNTTLTSVKYAAFRALIQLATIVHLGCVRSSPFSLCGVCLSHSLQAQGMLLDVYAHKQLQEAAGGRIKLLL